jgi:two-component system, cell cycle sensor histidine kinase and response regulator CckA
LAETTILVVEDEEQVRTLVVRVLQKQGYSVLQAENGRVALEIARTDIHRISLVITDLVMPELGGGRLVHELRALKPDMRVLCMTGYTKEEVLTGDGLEGAVFIEKPFAPSTLLQQVEQMLN